MVFFGEIKKKIFPFIDELDMKELTLLYLFEFMISFETIEIDTFYSDKDYLK